MVVTATMADPLASLMQAIELAQARQVPVLEVSSSDASQAADDPMTGSAGTLGATAIRTPRSVREDVVMKSPPQAAAAIIEAAEGVALYQSAVATASTYLPRADVVKIDYQRRAAALSAAINASVLGGGGPPFAVSMRNSRIVIDPESPGVKALPKRQREELLSAYHNTVDDVARRYSAVLDDRVSFVTLAAGYTRFGSPFAPAQYPNKTLRGRHDPFSDFAKTTAPLETDTVAYTQEAFANNVPYKLTSAALRDIEAAYERGIENQNAGEFIRGLLELGFADSLSPDEDATALGDPTKLGRFIDYIRAATKFLGSDESLLEFTALVGVFPYQMPLNDSARLRTLRDSAVYALAAYFTDQENDAAFVDMYRSTLIKTFFNMKRYQSLDHLKRDAFTFTEDCPLFSKYSHIKLVAAGSYGFVVRVMPRESHRPSGTVKVPGGGGGGDDDDDAEEMSAVRANVKDAEKSERYLIQTAPLFAVKIQSVGGASRSMRTTGKRQPGDPLDTDHTAFTELMVLQTIKQKSSHWRAKHRASNVCNHVRLFDFVRCAFNPVEVFTPLLREDDYADTSKRILPDRHDEWQIMVLEYADSGTLDSFITDRNPKNTLAMASWEGFAGVTIQVLGHIESLRGAQYTHHDVKPLNILLSAISPQRKCGYFAYKDVAYDAKEGQRRTLYVPVWGIGYVAKLSDTGLSAITGTAPLPNGKKLTHYIPSKAARAGVSGHKYNPAIDLELYGYTFLRAILTGLYVIGYSLADTCKAVDWRIFHWIRSHCRQNPHSTRPLSAALNLYDALDEFLSDAQAWNRSTSQGESFPSHWKFRDLIDMIDKIYSVHSIGWHGVVPEGSYTAIARALAYPGFKEFTHAPDRNKYTEQNGGILVMSDYHD